VDIVIFDGITTNDALEQLKLESEKYTGLYVDMNEPEQRKYVKEKAESINQLLKKLDRARIDTSKNYKLQVEAEAADIKERLEIANLPFTLLIDEHKAERKKILDAEKARKQAILDAEQYELDHEMSLLMNKTFEFDREQEVKAAKEESKRIEAEALKKAVDRLAALGEKQEQDKINAENARLANVDHVRTINRAIFQSFVDAGVSFEDATIATQTLIDNKVPNTTINY